MTPTEWSVLVFMLLCTTTIHVLHWMVYHMMRAIFASNRRLWECYLKDSELRSQEWCMMAGLVKDLEATNRALKEARRRAEEG